MLHIQSHYNYEFIVGQQGSTCFLHTVSMTGQTNKLPALVLPGHHNPQCQSPAGSKMTS